MFRSTRVNVTPDPIRLDVHPDRDNQSGQAVLLCNRGTVPIYIGGPDVTATNGFQVDPGQTPSSDYFQGDHIWAVTETGSARCDVLQQGV